MFKPQPILENIYYNDSLFDVKELGINVKVTPISNVTELTLEECVKTIFESNKDIKFNIVQYSRSEQSVYFYTDKDINLEVYKEKIKNSSTKHIVVLKEIKNILTNEKNKELDSISLYSVAQIINEKVVQYEKTKHKFDYSMEYILRSKFGSNCTLRVTDFDYINQKLKISFNPNVSKNWKNNVSITFGKNNGVLYLDDKNIKNSELVLSLVGNYLSKLYDDFMKHKDFMTQSKFKILSNSKFLVNITKYGIDICAPSQGNKFKYDFELSLRSLSKVYESSSNSSSIIRLLKGKESEIFKRVFVKIEECPENLRESLYELRCKELMEKDFLTSVKEKSVNLTKKVTSLLKNKTK